MIRRILSTETFAMLACMAGCIFIALAIVMQDPSFWSRLFGQTISGSVAR